MGERWSINQYGGITRDGCFLAHNEIPITANADCDAYEARIAELEAKVKSQRSRISQLTHGMAEERKANNKLLANIEQLKEWNTEALEENNRLDAEADAARQYAHAMDLQNADYGRVVDELARVKAVSLRVVECGETCLAWDSLEHSCVLYDGVLWKVSLDSESTVFMETVDGSRPSLKFVHGAGQPAVQPVRLVRLEDVG